MTDKSTMPYKTAIMEKQVSKSDRCQCPLVNKSNILVPFRRPFFEFSKPTFVRSLKPEARAPEAAKPARKDCKAFNCRISLTSKNKTTILKDSICGFVCITFNLVQILDLIK